MNATTKRAYDAAYRQLAKGLSATYTHSSGGSYSNGELISGNTLSVNITCYEDIPTTEDVQKGLASISDTKILVSAKALGDVVPSVGGAVVFSDVSMTVKQVDSVKSLEGIDVLYMLFSSRMA